MKTTVIWMCETLDDYKNSEFASTKKEAERKVASKYGFDSIRECVLKDWAKRAVKISVPAPVAARLLK